MTTTTTTDNKDHKTENGTKMEHHFEPKAIICLDDFERLAKERLEEPIFNLVHHGSDEEWTLRWNRQMIVERYFLKPRILCDISEIKTRKYVFGDKLSMPIGIAPTGLHSMFNERGELATVRAAFECNSIMILSQFSTTSLEDVAKEGPLCKKWQNIYLLKNKEHMQSIINRAMRYGYRAIVITCDSPVLGKRRHAFEGGLNLEQHKLKLLPENDGFSDKTQSFGNHLDGIVDKTRCWSDLAELKKQVGDNIRVIVKGIMTPEDAEMALNAGIDGIYVSNHGGRQLDCCQSTIEALPAIVEVVNKRVPVFIDGGFRTGGDVMKALALGADMVFIGRPVIYGLAVGGEKGVAHMLATINEELKRCMALCGCRNLSDITGNCIMERSPRWSCSPSNAKLS